MPMPTPISPRLPRCPRRPRPAHRITPAARAFLASCGVFVALGAAGVPVSARAFAQDAPPASLDGLAADALDERTLDNLVAWARLHGYLRHFNPSQWAWTTDMNALLRDGFAAVLPARTPAELAEALRTLMAPVGGASRVWATGDEAPPTPDLRAGARDEVGAVSAWRHEGFTPTMTQNGPMFSRRILHNITAHEALRYGMAPDHPYVVELPGGVTARVHHAAYVDRKGNVLPDPPPVSRVRREWPNDWDYTRAGERLAAVAEAWSLVQHFHPSIDRDAIGWERALRDGLRDALAASDRAGTLRAVQRMLAKLGDAQAEAWDPKEVAPGVPPLHAEMVEGAVVVTAVDGEAADLGVRVGDEIVSIDGVRTGDALAEWRARMGGATPEACDVRALLAALCGRPMSEIALEVRSPTGAVRKVVARRSRPAFVAVDDGSEPIRQIAPDIVYVDGSRATDEDILEQAKTVLQSPGVIVDLRSPFTDLGMPTLGWLVDAPAETSEQYVLTPVHPDFHEIIARRITTRVTPNPGRAMGKFVFLVGPQTRGDAEFAALTAQDFDLGFLVGTHTAGAAGRPADGVLPGGLRIQWTGLDVRAASGTEIFGRGVPPDVEAPRTRSAARAGQDPAVDAAVRLLNDHFESLRRDAQNAATQDAQPSPAP